MENRNSLQPIRTAAPADRLLGRVCSVGGRRYLDCGFDQLIAVSDADAARYADGAFVEVEIAAGATPWHDAVSQQQAVQQSFDQLIASIRERTTLEVGLAAADVERLRSELTSPAPSGRRFRVYAPGNSCHFTLNPKNCTGEHLFHLLAGERIEAQCWDYTDFNRLKTNVDEPVCLNPVRPAPVEAAEGECFDVYVNRAVDFGLFVTFGGNDGLIHKKSFPNYDERFRSGEIAAAYRRGMKIPAKLLSKTLDEKSGRVRYTFDPVADDTPVAFDALTLDVGDTVTVQVNSITRNGLSVRYRGEVHTVDRNSVPNCTERFRNGVYHPNQPLRVKMIRRNDKLRHFLFELLDKTVDYGLTEGDILRCEITPTEIPDTTEIRTTIDGRACSFHLHPQELPFSLTGYLREHTLETEVRVCGFFEHGDPKFQFKSLIVERIRTLDDGLTLDAEVLFEDEQAGRILWRAGEVFGFLPVGSYSFPMARNIAFSPGERIAIRVSQSDGKTLFRLAQPPVNPWDSLSGIAEGKRIRVEVCDVREDGIRIGYDRVFGILKPHTARRPEAGETVEAFVSRFSPSEAVLECFSTDYDAVPDCLEPGTEYDLQVVAHAAGAGKLWALQQERLLEIELERPEMPDYVTECLLRHGSRIRVRAEERDGVRRVRLLYDKEALWAQAGLHEGDRCYPVIAEVRPDRMIVTHRDVIGYIPNDELDWNSSRIVDRSAYRPGMQVEALVLRADAASGELVFSRKALLEDPWPAYPHREGDTTEGTVAAVLPNGNLLVNADGIVGEVLKYNVSWFNFQSGMNRYRTGDRLRVQIMKFDPEARVLFLSGTGGTESPWNGVNYRVGAKYEVTVLRSDRMAVMVALDGIIGEITRERIGWITPPSAEGAFAEGERIEAQLIFINRTKRVAQFSRKAVLPDPWTVPIAEGDVVDAKVVEASAAEVRFDVGGRLGVCSREMARAFVAGACGDVQPDALFHPGELRRVRIEGIDRRSQRLYVGSPDREDCRPMVGRRFDITVLGREWAEYRVETADGIRGMLPFERATWSAPETSRLAPGDRLEAQAAAYDFKRGCLLFDRRTLIPDPWKSLRIVPESFIETQFVAFDAGSAIVRYEGIDLRLSPRDTAILAGKPWLDSVAADELPADGRFRLYVAGFDAGKRRLLTEPRPQLSDAFRNGAGAEVEVKRCTEEGIHVFCPGEGCFGFIPREEIIWGIVDSACSLYDEGEKLWVCNLDYDAARGLCRFSRRRLLAGASVPFVAGARLSARITRITEKLMVVKCNDTEASVLLGDTTWTPPFRLGERYLPTRYAAGGEIEAVVERLETAGVPRLSIRRLQPNPWLYCPVPHNGTVVAEVVGHCGERTAAEYAGYAGLIEDLAPGLGSTLVPGDRVAVCCKVIDREQGRLRFSLVKILPRPWVEAGFRQYGTVECSVVSVGDDRTLTVEAAGYTGIVPRGELAWGEPSATFVPGQRLSAVILRIDYENLALTLSLRYAEGIPPANMPLRIGEAHRFRITDVRTAARKMPEQLAVESVEMPALRGVIFARDLAWERAGRSAAAYRPGEEIEAVVTDLMPRKLTFKASLRDMVDDTRSLDDIRPGEKLDVTLRKFIPQEFAAEVSYYDYAGRLTLDAAVWSGVENLANFFRPGREIEAEVTAVDPDKRSLAFRLPEGEYTPDWEGVRLAEGDTLEVTADYVMDSALFVNYHGIVVTLRREELSWLPVFRIGENYRDGDTLRVKVKRFDRENRILKFSVRELLPNPFLQEMPFAEGDLVRGTVMQTVPQGIYVDCSGYPCYIAHTEFAGDIHRSYKAGDALRARVLSIDPGQRKIRLTRRCEELSGEEIRFRPGEWLWFTVTERADAGLWAEYEGYRAFLSDADAGFRENENPSQRYAPGQLIRMRVTGIDEKANALTVSAELVSDYSQFDSCTAGTVDVAEVVHVAVKAITVCFRGIYCRVPLERASLFPIANAKMLYAVREQLTMVVEAADPETRTLTLRVQQRYNDWSEIPVRPGDRVSGEICFRSPRFGLLLRDGDLFYRVCAESLFWQPATELALYPIGSRCEEAVVERIDPEARMICVSIGTRAATDPFEQARLRNGDIVKATMAGGDRTVCVLRCGELYLSMPREEVLPGHAPECGDEVKVRVLSVDKVKRAFCVSQRAVTHDPLLTFSVGQKAEGTVQSLSGTMCLVRVNGLVGMLPVSEAQIRAMNIRADAKLTVYVSSIRFTKRQIAFSLTPTANNDLAVGSRVQCTVVKATAHHVFCTFPKRGRLYDAAIRSSEFYWNRPTDVPCQPGDRINAVITGEEIIGKTKYTTLNACVLTLNPLLTCETGDTLSCTVLGTTSGGYLMRCGGAVGFLHCSEIMWQYCDQWYGVWKRGEKVSCRILHLSPAEGGLLLGHRQTVGDPFLQHTLKTGTGYPATVQRSSDECVVVLLGDTGIEATISKADMKLFFTGVGRFIPQPGATISEVTVVRIENPGDPKRRHPFVRVTLL